MSKLRLIHNSAIFILIWNGLPALATVYDSDGSSINVQYIHDFQATDGDTITLPAGTFDWTTGVSFSKGITLRGATTITGAGGPNAVANDVTIVKDDVPRSSQIVGVTVSGSRVFRLTGITFAASVTQVNGSTDGAFHFTSPDLTARFRVDNCHFASLHQAKLIRNSKVYGVADHNLFEVNGNTQPFNNEGAIAGSGENGNAAWADYSWYGTDKFLFIEDNTLVRQNTMANSLVDSFYGGRWVARHNYMTNMIPSGHGTESGAGRGQRANEFYDNTVNMTVPWSGGGQRSGSGLWHDNNFIGLDSQNGSVCNLSNFRETPARGVQPSYYFYVADGTCPWDQNDTEGNGTYVEGHPPYLFASGSATSGTTISGSTGTFTDSTKNWTTNQWAGYSIKNTNPNSACYLLGSYIISNTSNTITYYYYVPSDVNAHLIFNVGDTYELHRVLVMIDQNGRGRTLDAIYDRIINGTPYPTNPRCTCPLWPRSQLEPCYSWNNVYTPTSHVLGFGQGFPGQPTTKAGIDYFNLGGSFPPDTTPSAVSSTYTAAINGVAYTGTYVYPHPLQGGNQTPTPSPSPCPTISPTPSSTPTSTPSPTSSPTPTPTPSPPSPTPTPTPTATATATATPTPRHTPKPHPSHGPVKE